LLLESGDDVRAHFEPLGQYGLGTKHATDIIYHAVRRYAAACRESGTVDRCILKLDKRNAFNLARRARFLPAATARFPKAAAHLHAAYAATTILCYDGVEIPSAEGAQQGYGLAGLAHALDQEFDAAAARAAAGDLDLELAYHDDLTIAGSVSAVARYYVAFSGLCAVNPAKCEVICNAPHAVAAQAAFPGIPASKHLSFAEFELFGAPIGQPAFVQRWCESFVDRLSDRVSRVASMPRMHCAFATLSLCANTQLVNYHMRLLGAVPAWSRFDAVVSDTLAKLVGFGLPDETTRYLASASTHRGGLGIRSAALHAAAAHVASLLDSHTSPIQPIAPRVAHVPAVDPYLAHSVELVPVAFFHTAQLLVAEPLRRIEYAGKLQRTFSRTIDTTRHGNFMQEAPADVRLRVNSSSGAYASSFLAPPVPARHHWLSDIAFQHVLKLRLGLPVQRQVSTCQLCYEPLSADVHGLHTLSCMYGGVRTTLHNKLCDRIFFWMTTALWRPQREKRPFANYPDIRVDLLSQAGFPKEYALDIATISPWAHASEAVQRPGAAATSYGELKKLRGRYADVRDDASIAVVPIVVEHLGSWGTHSKAFFRRLARDVAVQRNTLPGAALRDIMTDLSCTLQKGVADVLFSNTTVANSTGYYSSSCRDGRGGGN
jgi:hypothetical protein